MRRQSVLTDGKSTTYDSDDSRLADSLADLLQNDAELAAVVMAWPTLPEHVRAAVMALVATAKR